MKQKLIVSGCSLSDYTKVNINYGEILSKTINYDYIHLAAGCGSNERIWRVVTKQILNTTITSNDTLVIQYTTQDRREFFSRHGYNDPPETETSKFTPLRETFKGGEIIKYKLDADTWQPFDEEKKFFKIYQDNFLSVEYNVEVFLQNHYRFLCLLAFYKIRTVFIESIYLHSGVDLLTPEHDEYIKSLSTIDTKLFSNLNICDLIETKHYQLSNDDPWHLNELGHEAVADRLKTHLGT